MDARHLSLTEVNKTALDHFIYQPVSRDMIAYLAAAAHNVIACDSTASPPSSSCGSASTTPSPPPRDLDDSSLPTVEEFITQLVVSSNVQVPTLMSTLVYLGRLKSKLQPLARGLRCTTHRIFLASLILAAKYLNDSSPKNKHWANYTHITTEWYSFGFSRTEVNLMEKQLLFLLEWDLRIDENDLYRELDFFLSPLREQIVERHARKLRQREEKRRQRELQQVAATAETMRWPVPLTSAQPAVRPASPEQHSRSGSSDSSVSPPSLSYSSSASSYASSTFSSRQQSRSNTPLEDEKQQQQQQQQQSYYFDTSLAGSLYDSPVEIVLDEQYSEACMPKVRVVDVNPKMLPYEISAREYQRLHEESTTGVAKKRQRRGMWGRLLGNAVAVR